MDATANTFTKQSNAKRAADAMIAKGTAPASEYVIERIDNPGHSDDGRFEIVWKLQEAAAVSEADVEMAEQNWSEPGTDGEEAAQQTAPVPGEAEAEPDPFPVGAYVHVQLSRLRIRPGHITQRVGQANRRVRFLGAAGGVTQLVDVAQLYRVEEKPVPPEEPKPARQRRRGQATVAPPGTRSRYGINPDLIAAGRLPDKAPEVTSAANRRYQVHFDKLLELATAGDWAAVRDYKITGSNSYSKMVARYREDLLAVRKAQEAAASQPGPTEHELREEGAQR